jgi:hypothetical protein
MHRPASFQNFLRLLKRITLRIVERFDVRRWTGFTTTGSVATLYRYPG